MALEQKYLNVKTRNEGYIELMMFIQDKNISISNVSSNDLLSYSDISSIINLDRYTSHSMATLEPNLWILNGAFYNPTSGRFYDGYISNSMSDENGDFKTNPKINLTLNGNRDVEYLSLLLNPSVTSAYPKQITVSFSNSSGGLVGKKTVDLSTITTLPTLVLPVNLKGINKVEIEYIGTQAPKRRARLSSVMFGTMLQITQDKMLNTDWMDKSSFVADSIPSRVFKFDMENYDKRYDIDNPDSSLPIITKNTEIMIRWGYNIAGYNEETGENENFYKSKQIEWCDFKHLRLTSVTVNNDRTVTFECGSVLDMMTDLYDRDIFRPDRTVREIVGRLLDFSGVDSDTVIFDGNYGDVIIDVPLPSLPVRELIQLCAYTCGATIKILDNGKILFADLDLGNPQIKTTFEYKDFTTEPNAEQLEFTTNLSLPTYTTIRDDEITSATTQDVQTENVIINYPAISSPVAKVIEGRASIQAANYYVTHCELTLSIPVEGEKSKVEVSGYKLETTKNMERSVTHSTLILDTQLLKKDTNNKIKTKYQDWYNKKFKYIMENRGEILVNATDFIGIQTQFSSTLKTYVLQNHITFDGAWAGDMEVIAL